MIIILYFLNSYKILRTKKYTKLVAAIGDRTFQIFISTSIEDKVFNMN